MTKEQEEAINFLELHTNFMGKLDKGRCIRIPEENFTKTKESIKTVLNMLKEKEAEIEKYKKLLADNLAKELNNSIKAKEKADTDLDDLDKGWKVELEKKDKMIDLIIDFFYKLTQESPGTTIHYLEKNGFDTSKCNNCSPGNDCRKCFKQYFERIEKNERI